MPPRPNSPRISYLPALMAVTISNSQGMNEKQLTVHLRAVLRGGQCPRGKMFRTCHGRSYGSEGWAFEGRLRAEHIWPCGQVFGVCARATVGGERGGTVWRKRSGFTGSATRKRPRRMEWSTSASICSRG